MFRNVAIYGEIDVANSRNVSIYYSCSIFGHTVET